MKLTPLKRRIITPFSESVVLDLTNSAEITVPAGAYGAHIWLWASGGGANILAAVGSGSGVTYRYMPVTPGQICQGIVAATNAIAPAAFFYPGNHQMLAAHGTYMLGSGSTGGEAFGGTNNYTGGTATPNTGGAAGGNTTTLAPCYRMRAADLNNIRAALTLAGQTSIEACSGGSPAWGSGGRSEKFLLSSAGLGGGGVRHDGGYAAPGSHGVLVKFVAAPPATLPVSYLIWDVTTSNEGTNIVPAGANRAKVWAIGHGSSGGGAGGCAYKVYTVSPGDMLTVTLPDLPTANWNATINGVTIVGYEASGATGGGFAGGDGGANGGNNISGTVSGALGGNATPGSWPMNRTVGTDVSGLFAAVAAAGHKSVENHGKWAAFGSGSFTEKFNATTAGFGGGGKSASGLDPNHPGPGCVVVTYYYQS